MRTSLSFLDEIITFFLGNKTVRQGLRASPICDRSPLSSPRSPSEAETPDKLVRAPTSRHETVPSLSFLHHLRLLSDTTTLNILDRPIFVDEVRRNFFFPQLLGCPYLTNAGSASEKFNNMIKADAPRQARLLRALSLSSHQEQGGHGQEAYR